MNSSDFPAGVAVSLAAGALLFTISPAQSRQRATPFERDLSVRPLSPRFAQNVEVASQATPTPEVTPTPEATPMATATSPASTLTVSNAPARLTAELFRLENQTLIAQSSGENLVKLEGDNALITARELRIDMAAQTVQAHGQVTVDYRQRKLEPRRILSLEAWRDRERYPQRPRSDQNTVDNFRGENLSLNFKTRVGVLDDTRLQVANLDINATRIQINGLIYSARDVLIRPGGLTEAERAIYGTPPFNLRAKRVTVDATDQDRNPRISVAKAGLYYKNTRLLPVPSYVFNALNRGERTHTNTFRLTPQVSFNSSDRVLVTTRLAFPLSGSPAPQTNAEDSNANQPPLALRPPVAPARRPTDWTLNADLGLSARVGPRGGVSVDGQTRWGELSLRARRSDIITTQLTNRIELDRRPEISYSSPLVPLYVSRSGYGLGVLLEASAGDFAERLISRSRVASGSSVLNRTVHSTRLQATAGFTTRVTDRDGPYLDLIGSTAKYGVSNQSYQHLSLEVGYQGALGQRVYGIFSYRTTSLSGSTPFRFDEVEIAREIRTTFDIQLSPRYLLPIDLRYDLDRRTFRDKSFGLLRSYKTFAYGISYDTARQDLHLEFRQGF